MGSSPIGRTIFKIIMIEIKKEEVNINELVLIKYRPRVEIFAVLGLGIVFLIIPYWLARSIGIAGILLALFCLYYVKDKNVLGFKDDKVYLFLDDGNIQIIDYEEIDEWGVRMTSSNIGLVYFILNNGQMLSTKTYQSNKANSYLLKALSDKETTNKALKKRSEGRNFLGQRKK